VQISLLNDLRDARLEYKQAKNNVDYAEADLYANVDFIGKGLKVKEQRDGFVRKGIEKIIQEEDLIEKENKYVHLKNMYESSLAEIREQNNFYGNVTAVLDEVSKNAVTNGVQG
jgi:uncharacterized Fe-S cluster-containing protein